MDYEFFLHIVAVIVLLGHPILGNSIGDTNIKMLYAFDF